LDDDLLLLLRLLVLLLPLPLLFQLARLPLSALCMPFEGFKGGGYDRSSVIRAPYSRITVATVATNEQVPMLAPVHPSLQAAFRPTRRYESAHATPYGRQFAASSAEVPYQAWSESLSASNFRAPTPKSPSIIGEISAEAYKAWRQRENAIGLVRA